MIPSSTLCHVPTAKPETGACAPSNVSAVVGSRNVNLTCLIEAHPTVDDVVWTTPDGTPIDTSSNHINVAVTNMVSVPKVILDVKVISS